MKFLLGLMNPPDAESWTMAYAEIDEPLYGKLLDVRKVLRSISDCNSIDLLDYGVHVFLPSEAGGAEVSGMLLSEVTEQTLSEMNYLRLPDDFELPEALTDPYDDHVCRTSFCELVVMADAIHWRIYPKHFDHEFDTCEITFDDLEQEFART